MKRRKPLPGGSAIPEAPKAMAANTVAAEAAIGRTSGTQATRRRFISPTAKKAFASRRFFFFALPHLINPLDLRFQPKNLGPVEDLLVSSNDSCGSRN